MGVFKVLRLGVWEFLKLPAPGIGAPRVAERRHQHLHEGIVGRLQQTLGDDLEGVGFRVLGFWV